MKLLRFGICLYRSMRKFIRRIFQGLRWRLLLLVLLACAPLVGLTLHTASEERRQLVKAWNQRSQEMMRLATQEESQVIGQTRQLLLALAESSPVRSDSRRDSQKLLDDLLGSYPRYANLGVVETNGMVLASAYPMGEPANQTNRPFFRRTLTTRAFAIGDFPDRQTVDKFTVNFGYPVFDSTGQVQAVVFATLDLDWVSQFESALPAQLPKGATWTEIDRNGKILVRYPSPEKWIGQSFPETSLLKTVFSEDHGVVETMSSNGVQSYHAFAAMHSQLVPDEVVTLLSSIPEQVLFAEANRRRNATLTGLGIAAGFAFMLGWIGSYLLVLRPVRTLLKSSARLANGDFSTRTGLAHRGDELGQLTHTFDHMAQALQQREMESKHSRHRLQVLSRQLVNVQEAERRHIALELHDEIGQTLTVAEMNLQTALQSPGNDNPPRLKESLDAVERVLEQVHDLALNLRPSMLDDLGLEPALLWLTKRQAELAGLNDEVKADALEHRLDPVIETECFRVAQEALTNVVRHAQAKAVTVELHKEDGQLHLCVRDDGIGFDVGTIRERAVHGASLGLLSMEERAALAGGGLEFNSVPGRGTEVHAWFPLKWETPPSESETP
jgi:signal transduction histidine kinase